MAVNVNLVRCPVHCSFSFFIPFRPCNMSAGFQQNVHWFDQGEHQAGTVGLTEQHTPEHKGLGQGEKTPTRTVLPGSPWDIQPILWWFCSQCAVGFESIRLAASPHNGWRRRKLFMWGAQCVIIDCCICYCERIWINLWSNIDNKAQFYSFGIKVVYFLPNCKMLSSYQHSTVKPLFL